MAGGNGNGSGLNGLNGSFGEESKELIGTIKIPKNLSLLTNVLPASQYEVPPAPSGHINDRQETDNGNGLAQIVEEQPVNKPAPRIPSSASRKASNKANIMQQKNARHISAL